MAKGSIAILANKIDVNTLIANLNMALSEEWLAFYQYWVGAQVIEGFHREDVEKELIEHAHEEFAHAELLATRIKELGGVIVLDPVEWFNLAKCKYTKPASFDVMSLLKENIIAERCAINRYQDIAMMTDGKDYITNDLAKHILAEEVQHEQELTDFVTDIETAIADIKSHLDK